MINTKLTVQTSVFRRRKINLSNKKYCSNELNMQEKIPKIIVDFGNVKKTFRATFWHTRF